VTATPAPTQAATSDRQAAVPGDLLLGGVPLVAIAVLVVNDHVLKAAWPGLVTGKMSDAAGLVFFPFLLVGAWELGRRTLKRPSTAGIVPAVVAIAATGVAFVLVKTVPFAGDLYRVGLGALQWPIAAAAAWVSGGPTPAATSVVLVADPSDLAMLPALAVPLGIALISRPPAAATWRHRRDLTVAVLAAAMFLGGVIDGWAHSNLASALENVLTPWHAIVYTSFALLAAVLCADAILTARSRSGSWSGRTLTATLQRLASLVPPGYGPTAIGIGIFVAAGIADTAWHVAFGIEANAEALVSPTHLLLGVGGSLIAIGPARSAARIGVAPRWPEFLPAVIAIATVIGVAGFATNLASPFVDAWAVYPYEAASTAYWAIAPVGIASVGLQSALVAGGIAALLRLWPHPPVGSLTVVILLGVAPLTLLHDQARLVLAPVAGAAVAEVLLAIGVRRRWPSIVRLRVITAVAPPVMWAGVVVALAATSGLAWSAHLIGGAFVVAACAGGLVGVLATLPAPATDA
jgi:hypothetical protein